MEEKTDALTNIYVSVSLMYLNFFLSWMNELSDECFWEQVVMKAYVLRCTHNTALVTQVVLKVFRHWLYTESEHNR